MSTDQKSEKMKKPAAAAPAGVTENGDPSLAEMFAATPEGWLAYGEAHLYRPEECQVVFEGQKRFSPLTGHPTAVKTIDGDNGLFNMILMTLTRPGIGLNRAKEQVRLKAGDQVIFTSTYAVQILEKCATHPNKLFEVKACPVEKISIGEGAAKRSLWLWDIKVNPVAKDRTQILTDDISNLLGAPDPIPNQLAEAAQA